MAGAGAVGQLVGLGGGLSVVAHRAGKFLHGGGGLLQVHAEHIARHDLLGADRTHATAQRVALGLADDLFEVTDIEFRGQRVVRRYRRRLAEAGIPVFRTPEPAVEMFAHVSSFYRNQRALMQTPGPQALRSAPDLEAARLIIDSVLTDRRSVLNEIESKALLSAFHIPVTSTMLSISSSTPQRALSG